MFLWIRTLFCIEYEIKQTETEGWKKRQGKVHFSLNLELLLNISRASYMFPGVCIKNSTRINRFSRAHPNVGGKCFFSFKHLSWKLKFRRNRWECKQKNKLFYQQMMVKTRNFHSWLVWALWLFSFSETQLIHMKALRGKTLFMQISSSVLPG